MKQVLIIIVCTIITFIGGIIQNVVSNGVDLSDPSTFFNLLKNPYFWYALVSLSFVSIFGESLYKNKIKRYTEEDRNSEIYQAEIDMIKAYRKEIKKGKHGKELLQNTYESISILDSIIKTDWSENSDDSHTKEG